MPGKKNLFLRLAFLSVIAVAGGSLFFTAGNGVEADLVGLLGDAAGGGLREAASAMSTSARFLVKAESRDAARERLEELGVDLQRSEAGRKILEVLAPCARGFLSPSTRDLLEQGRFPAVRDAAAARLFSPVPPVMSPRDDPFLLFTDYVLASEAPSGGWIAVGADLTPDQALSALAAVRDAGDVRCAGAPFHTAVATAASKREINVLSVASVLFTVFFGWMLTRSFRFLPFLVAGLAASFCVSSAVLFAIFGKPHLIAFVFGTTLIGMSVDYVYHTLTAKCSVVKPLSVSFLSTVACFTPLLFSEAEVLKQMALFTVAGLSTVFAAVIVFRHGNGGRDLSDNGERPLENGGRDLSGNGEKPLEMGLDPSEMENFNSKIDSFCKNGKIHAGASRKLRFIVLGVMGVVAIAGFCRQMTTGAEKTDLSRFYRQDPYLAEGERIAAEISGSKGFIPSAEEQRRNADLVRRLIAAEGTNYCQMVGLPLSVLDFPGETPVFAPREHLESALVRWAGEVRGLLYIAMLVLAVVFAVTFKGSFPDFALPMFLACGCAEAVLMIIDENGNFFARICFFIFIGLGFDYSVFRRHAMKAGTDGGATSRAVLYSFLTSFVGFGLLSFTDFAVTRLMGLTLATGLAASYVAAKFSCGFFRAFSGKGEAGGNRSVAQMGSPVGIDPGSVGIDPVKYDNQAGDQAGIDPVKHDNFLSKDGDFLEFKRKEVSKAENGEEWHEQRERCASLFWARFMWYSYAWFGKNFQKIIFVIGMPVIYLFTKPARVSLKKFYAVLSDFSGKDLPATTPRLFMHILRFSWGLMDKTDSCTLRKNPPKMSVRDDEGWRAFLETVNSGKGAFLLCTHVGMIGVLPSLPDALELGGNGGMRIPKVNAFQQMGHDAVFMKVFMEHFDGSRLLLHAVEDIGVETAVEMKSAIERGELVIMAGDRVSAGSKSVLRHRFMGRDCVWPKGVYRFAKLMESPVFAVTCVAAGWNRYEVHVAELPADPPAMFDGFVSFLERETLAYPGQWYQFYDFFRSESDE